MKGTCKQRNHQSTLGQPHLWQCDTCILIRHLSASLEGNMRACFEGNMRACLEGNMRACLEGNMRA